MILDFYYHTVSFSFLILNQYLQAGDRTNDTGRISGQFLIIFMFRQSVLSQILRICRRVVTFVTQEPAGS